MANQKGGVGKTANIIHLAFYLAELGKKVLLIDLDTQANATYTLEKFKGVPHVPACFLFENHFDSSGIKNQENLYIMGGDASLADVEKIDISKAAENFRSNIGLLAAKFDYCLIDTAPALGVRMTSALIVADYVISPIELETYSIQGIKLMLTTVKQIKKYNPGLTFLGMVASKVDRRNPRHVEHLDQLMNIYPDLILKQVIGLRSSVADAIAQGVPVWKIRKTAARVASKEIKAFAAHITKTMENK